jgi:hypothetical protein
MIYQRTKFHMPFSSCSVVIAVKEKAKCTFRVALILFYVRQKYINPLKPKLVLITFEVFSPYRKENTTLHHYKDQLINAVLGNNHCIQ